jgi:serpin B
MKRHGMLAMGLVSALGLAMLAVSACTTASTSVLATSLVPSGTPQAATASAPVDGVSAAIDAFGVGLLKATSAGSSDNVIVSPVSVAAALSMTVNGATGETADQMRHVLHTDSMTPATANLQWAALLSQLESRSASQTLDIADSLWANKSVAFKQPFLSADRDSFGAQISSTDFGSEDVAGAINRWVNVQTHAMIPKIVDQVPGNAVLYLANAVYFKGDWALPFTPQLTQKQPFTKADGTKLDVQMMHSSEPMPYTENAALRATKLTYEGYDSAFYVFLPKPGVSMAAAMASLEASGFSNLRQAMDSAEATEVDLGLPRLDVDFSTELSKVLKKMGMPRAFDANAAQFDGMADIPGAPIYIGVVLHKTKVKVDEKGTEAAAATVVEMLAGAEAPLHQPVAMICDHPYLFAIVDEHSGAMLFLGVVNAPK